MVVNFRSLVFEVNKSDNTEELKYYIGVMKDFVFYICLVEKGIY